MLLGYQLHFTDSCFERKLYMDGVSRNDRGRLWLLPKYEDDYQQLKFLDPKEYYAGLRREWVLRVQESENLVSQLCEIGSPII